MVANDEIMTEFPALNDPAIDPIDTPLAWLEFRDLIEGEVTTLKGLLTEGRVLVGIGSMYADEVLFDAGLRFDRESNTLSTQEVRRLYRSLVETLHNVIKYRGTTLEDRPWSTSSGNRACSINTSRSTARMASSVPGVARQSKRSSSTATGPISAKRRSRALPAYARSENERQQPRVTPV